MNKYTNPLNKLKVASPCSADWNEMAGDERKRFCGQCNLNVYNLSGMTRDEAENLLITSEGRLCIRFYRRADGTILTEDCPVGWAKVKQRISKTATAAFSLFAGLFGGVVGYAVYTGNTKHLIQQEPTMGTMVVQGEMEVNRDSYVMGSVANVSAKSDSAKGERIVGRKSLPKKKRKGGV